MRATDQTHGHDRPPPLAFHHVDALLTSVQREALEVALDAGVLSLRYGEYTPSGQPIIGDLPDAVRVLGLQVASLRIGDAFHPGQSTARPMDRPQPN